MTVGEMLAELSKYPHDLQVGGYWEGMTVPISGVKLDERPDGSIVVIDVDNVFRSVWRDVK